MTDDEKDRALCEAHCNSAADEYFNARPQLDSSVNRRIFYAGHRKAWIERGEAVRLNATVPDAQEKALLQAIQERDAAEDYIDALLDEVLGTDRPEWSSTYGHADAIEQVRETMGALMKPCVDKAWDRFQSAQAAPAAPQPRDDGMPASSDERHLRRLLAARVAMPNTYFDDGEAHGAEHGIQIDFMREPVAHIDAKLRALNVARLAVVAPQSAQLVDSGVMELAESVGLIGPASRTDDLHEAIQRFHDLIVVNASIKAALHFADGLAQPAQQPLTDDHDESELPESLINEVDAWFAQNTGLGGCSDKDVSELAGIFFSVTYGGGRESVDAALAVVDSFGPGVDGLNDTYARQVLLAQEVRRLRNALRTADEQQEGNSND